MKPASDASVLQTIGPLKQQFRQFIQQLRAGVDDVIEPKAQALLETSAEVLTGLLKAFEDYEKGHERAWQTTSLLKVPLRKKAPIARR